MTAAQEDEGDHMITVIVLLGYTLLYVVAALREHAYRPSTA